MHTSLTVRPYCSPISPGHHSPAMSSDRTRSLSATAAARVNYRCPCGTEFAVDPRSGGDCPSCSRSVGSKALALNLSVTLDPPPSRIPLALTVAGDPSSPRVRSPLVDESPDIGLVAGTRLGHFEIVDRLGSGGMGEVYRALDRSLHRYVALKVLRTRVETGTGAEVSREIEQLMQEAIAQARVPHPNVVSIYYVGKQDGAPFLAMELVAGKTLQERMEAGPMEFPGIVSIGIQLAEALRYSQNMDLIHGDLKPSNVLVQPDLTVKLSDFGMARRASGENIGPVGGTPNYLAPELLTGGQPSVQSDIFALGVTLYEMTFGVRPFRLSGTTAAEWAQSHRDSQLEFPRPWPESLPERWRSILEQMLQPDPAGRYANYDGLLQDLRHVMPSSNPSARWLPRIMAALIDYFLVVFFTVFLAVLGGLADSLLSGYLNVSERGWLALVHADAPWYASLTLFVLRASLLAIILIPAALYFFMAGYWRQSLGRELMHIQVVNRFGLPLAKRTSVWREVMRSAFLWALPLGWTVVSLTGNIYGVLILSVSAIAFTLVNAAMLVVTPTGRTIHDRIVRTRAVLNTHS